ncbi:ATP-binding protein [Pantoea stewartii]|uniref:ATP-binding protein n=1 Tax=Pantoea stewartii TaxID=66269 RepID=UPI002DB7BB04|nr:ATP-binding protein [Pantoea stewartii]MEB6537098.1 ATP-binding protein [Pantoea stewartii]
MRKSILSFLSDLRLNTKRKFLLWLMLVVALLMILSFSYYNFRTDLASQTEVLTSQVHQQGQELTFNISRYEFIPFSLSLDNNILRNLKTTAKNNEGNEINSRLKKLQSRVGAQAIFVVDKQGDIIFSSDAGLSDSLIGHNVRYRPYFQRIKAGVTDHYFGIGTTNAVPGYYQSTGYFLDGVKLGVVVVKVNINELIKTGQPEQKNILLDHNGVIVSTRYTPWLYHSLTKLPIRILSEAEKEHKYLSQAIPSLAFRKIQIINSRTDEISIDGKRYIMVRQYLPQIDMTLARLLPVSTLYQNILIRIALVTALLISVVVSAFILIQRNQIIHLRLENQQALRNANDRLEEQVRQRTKELEEKKGDLEMALRQRIESEQTLRNMQKELVRSEKLAVIGQLSAGLAHEINQPLSAIGMMSANALRLLDIAESDEAKANLERISKLVEFIGSLSSQLRSFSRRNDDTVQSVSVAGSIDNAMLLLGHRFKEHNAHFVRHPPEQTLCCLCNGVRLEQVLVNVIGNALDAVKEQTTERYVSARWYTQNGDVVIDINDNGTGIPDNIMEHIFEPFFTTKKNHGLGLGLAISADIIRSYAGSLEAENDDKGAKLTLRLPTAPETDQE